MKFIKFKVLTSGEPIWVEVDSVIRLSIARSSDGKGGGTTIRQSDGSQVEVVGLIDEVEDRLLTASDGRQK